ncbi:MAG: cell wall-associated NlpC family hydrolase [Candidatus Krumholzibacteriia bacterium]|jgi:cell wall-associated NlpC family hydrolase
MSSKLQQLAALCAVLSLVSSITACAPKRVLSTGQEENRPLEQPAQQSQSAPKTTQSAPADPPIKTTPAISTGAQAVELARAQIGKPYLWGASGPEKFDCSGLVLYVYKSLGVPLPRMSGEQASSGYHVDREDLAPGDLVFFRLTGGPINHVGIYVGYGKFIHAPKKNNPVRFDSLNDSWWGQKFKGGRRVG